MKSEVFRFVSWVTCLILFLAGLYSGAYITSTTEVLWERITDVGTVVAALVSALVASYVGWLNYEQNLEKKKERSWEFLKSSLLSLLKLLQRRIDIGIYLSGVAAVRGGLQSADKKKLEEDYQEITVRLHGAFMEFETVWGEFPEELASAITQYEQKTLQSSLEYNNSFVEQGEKNDLAYFKEEYEASVELHNFIQSYAKNLAGVLR